MITYSSLGITHAVSPSDPGLFIKTTDISDTGESQFLLLWSEATRTPAPPPLKLNRNPKCQELSERFCWRWAGYLLLHWGARQAWHGCQAPVLTAIRGEGGTGGGRNPTIILKYLIIQLKDPRTCTAHQYHAYKQYWGAIMSLWRHTRQVLKKWFMQQQSLCKLIQHDIPLEMFV